MGAPWSIDERMAKVVTEQMRHDIVTDRIRPRITDGASRESCGEGRVVDDM